MFRESIIRLAQITLAGKQASINSVYAALIKFNIDISHGFNKHPETRLKPAEASVRNTKVTHTSPNTPKTALQVILIRSKHVTVRWS